MSYAYHCDRDGCDSWQKVNSSFHDFLELTESGEVLGHFCCMDCLLHFAAANSVPTEIVE